MLRAAQRLKRADVVRGGQVHARVKSKQVIKGMNEERSQEA